mmetsp:Transcript_16339/g.51345  ORF Transcript_16339/g.51345 Transcript_16339/m.51345 type:complete len:201 (+) Transcript_16339:387-989(+)
MLPWLGRYTTFLLRASVAAISLAASILRSSISPTPADLVASEISRAASDSPSARMTAALRSWSALSTTYVWRCASCSATCFDSIALVNSAPNERCVMATSSSWMLKSLARAVSPSRILWDTWSRMVRSWSALYWATTDLSTSLPIEGRTRSSKSRPSICRAAPGAAPRSDMPTAPRPTPMGATTTGRAGEGPPSGRARKP